MKAVTIQENLLQAIFDYTKRTGTSVTFTQSISGPMIIIETGHFHIDSKYKSTKDKAIEITNWLNNL